MNRKKITECRREERRRKCVTTGGDRGGRRVNPARISAPDETKIARRRVRLHAARQCRRAGPRAPAGCSRLRRRPAALGGSRRVSLHCVWLQSELRPALYVEALRARRRRPPPALARPLQAIPGVICSTVYAKFYTFLNIHKLSTLMIQSFMKPKLVFSVTHTCYVYYFLNIIFQEARRRCTSMNIL